MSITWSSLVASVSEVAFSATESDNADDGSSSASVKLHVPWSGRRTVINEILGSRKEWPYTSAAIKPRAFSAATQMFKSTPATNGQGISYDMAEITVQFSTKSKEVISESLEPTVEFLTEDWRRFRWGAADGVPILENEKPGRLRHGLSLVRTMHEVPIPLPESMLTLPGSCNNAEYESDLLGLTFGPETLLFGTPRVQRSIKLDGTSAVNLTLSFTHKPSGWNKFWRSETMAYEEMFDVDGLAAYKSYPPEDFSDYLF